MIPPLLAFGLSLLLHWATVRLFPKFGLVDFPQRYGHSRAPIPYPAGIVSVAIFLGFFLVLAHWDARTLSIAIGIVLLALFCFWDDRRPLSPVLRLTVQILCALLIFAGGARIYTITNPLEIWTGIPFIPLDRWTVDVPLFGSLPVWSGLFTVLWLGLTVNALNWFDGIPGQVTTLSTIGFLTIGLLAMSPRVDQSDVATIAFILAGISAGALVFDVPPPKLLIGDTGAMFLGLMLGVLTIYSGGKVATAFLVLGVPLFDVFFVVARRMLRSQSPFRGSMSGEHLHHRLLARGWSARSIILLTASIGTGFGCAALFLSTSGKALAAAGLLVLMAFLSWYSAPRSKP